MSFRSADWRREIYTYAMLPLHGPYGWCIDFSFAPSCFLLLIRNNNGGRIDSRCSYSCFPFRGCSFVFFKNGTFSRKAAGRPAPSCVQTMRPPPCEVRPYPSGSASILGYDPVDMVESSAHFLLDDLGREAGALTHFGIGHAINPNRQEDLAGAGPHLQHRRIHLA